MANNPDNKVYNSTDGKSAVAVPSDFGILRIQLDERTKRAFACIVQANGACEISATYRPISESQRLYEFKINEQESLDASNGPKLGAAVIRALSGTTVSEQAANEVGQLLVNAKHAIRDKTGNGFKK